MYTTQINIANILIELKSSRSLAELETEDRLISFLGSPKRPSYQVFFDWSENIDDQKISDNLLFDPGKTWKLFQDGSNSCFVFQRGIVDNNKVQVDSIIKTNSFWNQISIFERFSSPMFYSIFNTFATNFLIEQSILFTGGVVFHASSLDDNGKGIVFVGHSGAGKSTQLQIWDTESGTILINDDRTAVRIEGGKPICYGTPWSGSINVSRNHSAPIKALFLLEQASENSIYPVPPSSAIELLIPRTYLPYWDKSLMNLAMENLSRIILKVPIFILRCRPEDAVIQLVRSVI